MTVVADRGGSATPPQALLVDLDGVVRRWDRLPSAGIEDCFGMPPGAVARVAFESELLEAAVLGHITDEVWRARIVTRLAETYGRQTAAAAVAAWSVPVGVVDQAVLELIRTVRQRARVCLVTNATTRLETDLVRLGIADAFDAIVNSARIGVRKPDAAIFAAALAAVDVPAARALFVDDTPQHVAAAQTLGLRGHVYTGVGGLRAVLRAAGFLPSG